MKKRLSHARHNKLCIVLGVLPNCNNLSLFQEMSNGAKMEDKLYLKSLLQQYYIVLANSSLLKIQYLGDMCKIL